MFKEAIPYLFQQGATVPDVELLKEQLIKSLFVPLGYDAEGEKIEDHRNESTGFVPLFGTEDYVSSLENFVFFAWHKSTRKINHGTVARIQGERIKEIEDHGRDVTDQLRYEIKEQVIKEIRPTSEIKHHETYIYIDYSRRMLIVGDKSAPVVDAALHDLRQALGELTIAHAFKHVGEIQNKLVKYHTYHSEEKSNFFVPCAGKMKLKGGGSASFNEDLEVGIVRQYLDDQYKVLQSTFVFHSEERGYPTSVSEDGLKTEVHYCFSHEIDALAAEAEGEMLSLSISQKVETKALTISDFNFITDYFDSEDEDYSELLIYARGFRLVFDQLFKDFPIPAEELE